MTTRDKSPIVDMTEARKRRAEILQQYREPFDAFCDSFEAGSRAVWADVCKQKGETVPFEQWFYATDENGDCPFEIAGAHIRGIAPRDEP
jgi:hypothetical protein